MRITSLTLLVAGVLLAGCGGAARSSGPRLAATDAAPLIALAHRIGHEGACAQARDIRRLTSSTVVLVNAGRIPAELAEPLMSGVNALAEHTPPCLPPVKPTPPEPAPEHHGHGHGHGHGKDHGDGD